jgi:hypothetical protein
MAEEHELTIDAPAYKRCIMEMFDDIVDQCTVEGRVKVKCLEQKMEEVCKGV